jgi:glycosyltransferase involved in cell wall biosynthesis
MVNKDAHRVDNQQSQYTFTVFTPTYNREHTLDRVYNSLKVQTYHNFEWLIVDDGSTDNTHDLVKQWQAEADLPLRYIYQNNKGKHTAYNLAAREAGGKFIICLDSDDGCIAEALARFKYHWDTIPEHEQDKFSSYRLPMPRSKRECD